MASEEQISRNLTDKGISIGEYELFPLHSTTIKQYKHAKIIQNKGYGDYEDRRPDGLLVDRRNKTSPQVIALLEYKKPKEFQTDKQKKEAVEQCNDLCQVLEAKIGIITDGIVTHWINPNNLEQKNEYTDRTNNTKRSYSFILNDDKQKLQKKFHISEINQTDIDKFDDETKETYQLIERILSETNPSNSILKATEKTDPTPLAKSVWQSIYISTKDNPTACLYNVVEIFIFKFLSDLGVLKRDYSFDHLIKMYEEGYPNKEVLEHYATKGRKKIKELFNAGDDGTGIINGTIFVNRDGTPVLSQATLFRDTIEKYAKFGDLRNIKKEFKTKLFETFLKQSKDKSKLGQFFTPRKVVKAIVEMADIDKVSFICDPFCGVGGFILEPFQISTNLKNRFIPKNGKINSNVKLLGYDTGREDNDEQRRTIILAKANMLIYFSDVVEKNPTLNKEFERIINDTFHFLSDSNLGSLRIILEKEEDKPDLIMTNPPYITSGVATIRKQIEEEGLSEFYADSGHGVQGLCLKWIISNLKKGGSAFVILPDGVFNISANNILRKEIKQKCFINCIISLPVKTFFNTPQKTYILGITKKENENQNQDFPVFTYLVSNIGETLDIKRFEIEENDLDKAKNLFNQYKGSPNNFTIDDPRCRIQPIEKFNPDEHWSIDRWWTKQEKIKLGIEEEEIILTLEEFKEKFEDVVKTISTLNQELDGLL
jgi:type I restriction enzyme M protein